ncbi:MAG: glutamate--tRNA ligase, partial [Deltaproteobacteria bacterium]|nr:glutamate--tRNA ligase [Deltaproteobacteria bacterium]
EAGILRALRWLGIQWDEGPDVGGPAGPYRQSERTALYREHTEQLLARGAAYRCFCTAERLDALREEQRAAKSAFQGYDGRCRDLAADAVAAHLAAGTPYVVRLRFPREGETVVTDRFRGEVRTPNRELDDQVLLKSDGFPTYHLANVVDDHLMGVTHVIRAEEWLRSTPKHLELYRAFGWQPPEFVHMPLLRNKDRSKISKRKNPVSLDYYRRIGILPEAMVNFLANIGYSLGDEREKFSLAEMLEGFDLDRVRLGSPVFDVEKLHWLNGLYLRDMPPDALADRILAEVLSPERVRAIAPLIQERIERLDGFIPATEFFFAGDELTYDPGLLVAKKQTAAATADVLEAVIEHLDGLRGWTVEGLDTLLRGFCEREGWKPGQLFMPLRVAITGRVASPGLFETMTVVGKPMCQARLRRAVERLRALPA